MTVDQSLPYTITGAPRVANGLVYIGNGGAEYGVRGYVSAYDAETGELRWRFYTVPGDPAKGPTAPPPIRSWRSAAETWTGEWWKVGGGGTVWDAIVYDPEFDQLLVGVGNGSPWNQQVRSPGGGDNLFLASIVALDAKTGAYKWHYQTTPGETWDYTATQPIILADLTIDGTRPQGRDAGAEERLLLRHRSGRRPADLGRRHISTCARRRPRRRVRRSPGRTQSTRRPAGPIENQRRATGPGTALIHPDPDGGAQLAADVVQSATRASSTSRPRTAPSDWRPNRRSAHRPGFGNLGVTIGPLPDDPQIRKAIGNVRSPARWLPGIP